METLKIAQKIYAIFEESGILAAAIVLLLFIVFAMAKTIYSYIKKKIEDTKLDIDSTKAKLEELQDKVVLIEAKTEGSINLTNKVMEHEKKIAIILEKIKSIFRIIDRRKKQVPVDKDRRKK